MRQRGFAFRFLAGRLGLVLGALVAGCSDESTGPRHVPAAVQVVAGQGQQGTVGQPLDSALTIYVADKSGDPVSGVLVHFSALAGNGSVSPLNVTTGSDGEAKATWTLPTASGVYHATATVSGFDSLPFTATAVAAAPATVAFAGGLDQSALLGQALDSAITIRVRDAFDNPVEGAVISLSLHPGRGSVPAATVLSDSGGLARTSWVMASSPGVDSLTATLTGLPSIVIAAEAHPSPQVDSIGLGITHSCRLQSSAATACWGLNFGGEVGTGDSSAAYTPTGIVGDPHFTSIAVGGNHTCGLTVTGQLYCWGFTDVGLGLAPTLQPFAQTFSTVAAGWGFTCGLTANAAAFCWGSNGSGQLGDGSLASRIAPTPVLGGLRFRQLLAGDKYACGLSTSGRTYCWGNWPGHQGSSAPQPVLVAGVPLFTTLAGGLDRVCGLSVSGAAWCWGIGLGPAAVPGGLVFQRLAAGGTSVCGVSVSSAGYCWGDNTYGQLGTGDLVSAAAPVAVAGGRSFAEILLGQVHACGRTLSDELYCWGGDGSSVVLGNGEAVHHRAPIAVAGGIQFTQLSAGDHTTCGVTMAGTAWCWGANVFGQLGDGTSQQRNSPVAVTGGHQFTQISSGATLTCGVEAGGVGFCWGGSPVPVAVPIDSAVASISAGRFHACAVTLGGEGFCWGDNIFGELGDSTTVSRSLPAPVAGGHRWQVIRAGLQHTCGIDSAGIGWCWGADLGLGNGARPDALMPDSIEVPDTLQQVFPSTSLAQGCAVTRGQAGYCWGIGSSGQLGDDAIGTVALAPVGVTGGNSFVSIEIGNTHACGLTASGGAVCWGGNSSGELGDGSRVNRPAPGPVIGGVTFVQVVVGTNHACGLDVAGAAYCWGSNLYGELGAGVAGQSPTPLLIP